MLIFISAVPLKAHKNTGGAKIILRKGKMLAQKQQKSKCLGLSVINSLVSRFTFNNLEIAFFPKLRFDF